MNRSERAGFSFVELIIAIAMITAILTITTQMLGVVAVQLRGNRQRLAAVEDAGNLMELITALPDQDLGPDTLQLPAIQESVGPTLDRWHVDLRVTPIKEGLSGQRIEILLRRRTVADESPLRLTAWKYHQEPSSP